MGLVMGRRAPPNLADPDRLSVDLGERPMRSQRETPGAMGGSHLLHRKEGVRHEGSVLKVREKLLEADLELARQAQDLCLSLF